MKKLHVLIPSLVATASMPFITLVGCGGDTPQPGKVEFIPIDGEMTTATVGTFLFDWTPSDHILKFADNWEFTSSYGNTTNIIVDESRPKTITLTFSSEITNDITDGKLTFKYEDTTTKQKDIAGEVNNIHITKYTPPPPPAPVEFDVSDGQMVAADFGTLKLNANPSSHELEFHEGVSWTFTSESTEDAYYMDYNPETQIVAMDFENDILSDINDGVLSFVYDDKTTGVDNISVTIENVHLDAYVPPTPPPGRINFNTCSWEDIHNACLHYEEEYHDPYFLISKFYFEDPTTHKYVIPTSLDDFAGQQRIIHLDGMGVTDEYHVSVLGISQDYTSSTDINAQVAITFQFTDAIGDMHRREIQWNDTSSNDYWNSYINKTFLNEELLSRIKDFTATSYIKPVYRTVASNDGQVTRQQVYCFMPTLSNLFSTIGLTKSFSNPTPYINEGQIFYGKPTIQPQYTYYQNNVSDNCLFYEKDNFDEPFPNPGLNITMPTGSSNKNYWLTTVLMNDSTNVFTVYSHQIEGIIQHNVVTDSFYVAPCFCI